MTEFNYISTPPPIPKLSTKQYIRLRAIAILIGVPTQLLLSIKYYLFDPSVLRKYQVKRRRVSIPSRERGRSIKVDVYEPNQRSNKPLPVHINWHGSGFVIPCFGNDGTFCAYLANKLGCVVLDCDYRKAPAHPFPAGPQDAEDTCNYVIAHPKLYDVTKISIGGTSAGGNLALGVSAKLGPEKIQAVCCIAPATDLRPTTSPKTGFDPGRHRSALPPWASRYFVICYLAGVDVKRIDPLVSPTFVKTDDLPSTVYIATGTGDTLFWDAKNLIDRLSAEGHPSATFRPAVGMGHAPHAFNPDDPSNLPLQMYQDIISQIRRSWTQPQGRRHSRL